MKIQFAVKVGDFAPPQSTREITPAGYLLCRGVRLGKAPQVRQYYAFEFGGIEGFSNDQSINVFTSADDLFKAEVVASFEGVEASDYHPPGNVLNAATWKDHAVGKPFVIRAMSRLETAGVGRTRRTIMYRRDPACIEMRIPQELQFLAGQPQNLDIFFPGHYLYQGVWLKRVDSLRYMDVPQKP